MGKAMIVYRVYPQEGYDLAKLVDAIGRLDKIRGVQREPIAFGLELVKCGFLIDDKLDKPEEIEQKLRKVDGVKEVETLDVTLIS
ncbi:hypothetical protein HYS54_00605 [Candidatus Micrarchaeota archaeon]|nr:hypothetical protein [Candidatus Micrarchaeota archaeon]